MEQRNLLIAIVLSLAIIFGFQFVLETMYPGRYQEPSQTTADGTGAGGTVAPDAGQGMSAPRPGGTPLAPSAGVPGRSEALAGSPRVAVDTPAVDGSISLRGGRLDDLKLKHYRETLDDSSPEVTLLSPAGSAKPYFVDTGWVAGEQGLAVPGNDTMWTASPGPLTPDNPLTLTWDNGAGLVFTRTISVDGDYLFQVSQSVRNTGSAPVTLYPYSLVSRTSTPETLGFFILHEGPVAVLDETLKEYDYDDLIEEGSIELPSTGGWIGITDKYWLVSVIPDQQAEVRGRFSHAVVDNQNKYQADFLAGAVTVAPGAEVSSVSRIFAGAKEVRLLDSYAENFGIQKFDLAIDFGWFYFLTKPLFYVIKWFHQQVGNFGIAIILLTILIKIVLFPLANKSYRSMSRMKDLQPEMLKLRERFGDDRQRLNQEMMALYKRQNVNPASGCLPIVVQIPVFFALYKVLFVTIEMRHAPFFGWIQDLSAPDPTSIFNLFGLIPFTPPEFLLIGVWPLIMGGSMWLQQKLNPQPPDPVQAKIFMFLPIVFTFLLARFPSGLVIYWAVNNILSIGQQWAIMQGMKKRPPAPSGGKAKAKDEAQDKDEAEENGEDGESAGDATKADGDAAESPASPRTTTSAARGKSKGRGRRRSRG